ncbi:hypothetical protein JXA88_18105 [Candidatus Fermentibacteria bacterium]|nr:hypothetical protein [Candidatus Fermentibacteria bacterium]
MNEAGRHPTAARKQTPGGGSKAAPWRLTLRRLWPELLLGATMGTAYLFVVPLWEAPDEPYHLANVAYVRKYGLYTLTHGVSELPQNLKAESSQPPVYYVVAAAASRFFGSLNGLDFGTMEDVACWDEPWRFYNWGDVILPRGLRALSLLFLLLCGLLVGHACTVARPQDPDLSGTAVAMMWAVPQVMFIGTAISNDSLAMAAGALILFLWMEVARRPSRLRFLLVGVISMLAVSIKFNLLPLAVAGSVVAPVVGTQRIGRRLLHLVLYALPMILAVGFVMLLTPDMGHRIIHVVGRRVVVHAVRFQPLSTIPLAWESFWGRFGWMNVPVHPWVRLAYWTCTVTLVMGIGAVLVRSRQMRRVGWIALLLVTATLVAFVGNLQHSGQAQGRHTFPAIAALSLLGAIGMRAYLAPRPARVAAWAVALCGAVYVLGIVMPEAYGEEPLDLIVGTSCCEGVDLTPSLGSGLPERQAFVSSRHNLTRVGIVPATHGLPVKGTVVLSLMDRASRELVASRTISGAEIRDGRYLFLDFPAIPDSRGRSYMIRVEASGMVRGRLQLFYSLEGDCPHGARIPGRGNLRFATYHLTHDRDQEDVSREH